MNILNKYGGKFANGRDALFFAKNIFFDYDSKSLAQDQEVKKEDIGIDRLV